jgi:hypothetical protein
MMSKLIADLDTNVGKIPYQTYTLRIGLDIYEVLVPLSSAPTFEATLTKGLDTAAQLFEVLKTHNGERVS